MRKEELYVALLVVMEEEQEAFRSYLMKCPPQKIMFSAPEYVIRDQIIDCMDEVLFDEEQLIAMIESGTPLSNIYARIEEKDIAICDGPLIIECILEEADFRVNLMSDRMLDAIEFCW